jgi:hypothetical protein
MHISLKNVLNSISNKTNKQNSLYNELFVLYISSSLFEYVLILFPHFIMSVIAHKCI